MNWAQANRLQPGDVLTTTAEYDIEAGGLLPEGTVLLFLGRARLWVSADNELVDQDDNEPGDRPRKALHVHVRPGELTDHGHRFPAWMYHDGFYIWGKLAVHRFEVRQ